MRILSAGSINTSNLLHNKLVWVVVGGIVLFYGYRQGWFQGRAKWLIVAALAVGGYYAYKHGYLNSFIHSTGGGGGRG